MSRDADPAGDPARDATREFRTRPASLPSVRSDHRPGGRRERVQPPARRGRLARQCEASRNSANDLLEQASGITIPSSNFVLRVILAYLIAVIPLNWLICRFVLNRREWTWLVVPLVALAFAIGVERVAARDIGYDTAADEIDLLEIHGDYPRAHLTRLVSLYSNGRSRFTDLVSQRPDGARLAV